MMKIIMTKGLPGSGKTSWAKKMQADNPGVYKRINKDDLRTMLDDSKHTKGNERFILEVRDNLINKALMEGKSVIVDDTNLDPKHEQRLKEIVTSWMAPGDIRAELEIKDFTHVGLSECLYRDSQRENPVGSEVIIRMFERYLKKALLVDSSKPEAFIFDIDGTLAKMSGRSPYEWSRVGEDSLNLPVKKVLDELGKIYKIIILSGRDGGCKTETLAWLSKNLIQYDELMMRPEGNTERDSIIKRRMYDELKERYKIIGVFDDRDQVVAMWRELGLTCFQVDYGNF